MPEDPRHSLFYRCLYHFMLMMGTLVRSPDIKRYKKIKRM